MVASDRATDLARQVLAKCAAYDPRFPRPSEAAVMAWAEHITLRNPTAEDMLAAVSKWYEEPHERVPLPADISIIAREFQRDRKSREPENVRRNREDIRDGHRVVELDEPRRERITMAEWEERHGEKFPALAFNTLDDTASDERRAGLKIRCRHCRELPGSPCVGHDGRPLTKTPMHACRIEEAEGRCAWWVQFHVHPHTEGCPLA